MTLVNYESYIYKYDLKYKIELILVHNILPISGGHDYKSKYAYVSPPNVYYSFTIFTIN